MGNKGCGCIAVVLIVAIVAIIAICCLEAASREISSKEFDRMACNAEWFACKAFPELSEMLETYKITVRWVSGDVEEVRDRMAEENGIKMIRPSGVWDRHDTAVGTILILDSEAIIFLKSSIAESEGEVWETFTHEMRHIYHDFHQTRTERLNEEPEPFRTLHEEIRTSREMVVGIQRFLANKKTMKEIVRDTNASFRDVRVKELKEAQEWERKLIQKYTKKLGSAKKRRAVSYAPPGWLHAPWLFYSWFRLIGVHFTF